MPRLRVTVFKNLNKNCFLVAFLKIFKSSPESCVPDRVGVFEKKEKGGRPEDGP